MAARTRNDGDVKPDPQVLLDEMEIDEHNAGHAHQAIVGNSAVDQKLHKVGKKKSGADSNATKRPSSSVIGVYRAISSCQRCRARKVRCDTQFPSCSRCAKSAHACVSMDPATGREIPRSYVVYLEDKIHAYMMKLKEVGVDPLSKEIKTNIPCNSDDDPCDVNLYQERFREPHVVPKENVMAGYVINKGTSMQKGVSNLSSSPLSSSALKINELSESSLTSEKVYKMKNNMSPNISQVFDRHNTPSSVSNSTRNTLDGSSMKSASLNNEYGNEDLDFNSRRDTETPGMPRNDRDKMSSAAGTGSKASTSYLGDSSGIPFAKLMFTAVNFEPSENATSTDEFNMPMYDEHSGGGSDLGDNTKPPTVSDDINFRFLPTKKEAIILVKSYFLNSNTQYPVLHREFFIRKYFEPIFGEFPTSSKRCRSGSMYDSTDHTSDSASSQSKTSKKTTFHSLANDFTQMNGDFQLLPEHSLVKDTAYLNLMEKLSISIDSLEPSKVVPLYEIITTIAPEDEIPLVYQAPLFFMNMVMSIGSASYILVNGTVKSIIFKKRAAHFINAIYGSCDRLEALGGLLLLSIYSLMLPNVPGVWYVMGNSLRLCVDLGLHAEKLNRNYDPFTKDMRRRLFWTTYSIDRQLCFYFGRPFGIPEESISTAPISELDDALITTKNDGVEDYSLMKTSASSYKTISLAFFKIRNLQSVLLQVLFAPNGTLPRPFEDLEEWRKEFDRQLSNWYKNSVPKSIKKMNCAFKRDFFKLNLYHTRTLLYGISPKFSIPNDQSFIILNETTSGMMEQYYKLYLNKTLNFTWIAIHNLFMCGMTFLYTKYRNRDFSQFDDFRGKMLLVLKSLFGTCEAAPNCYKIFKLLSNVVKKLVFTQSEENMASIDTENEPLKELKLKASNKTWKTNEEESPNGSDQEYDIEIKKFFQDLQNGSPFSNVDSVEQTSRDSSAESTRSGITLDGSCSYRPVGFEPIQKTTANNVDARLRGPFPVPDPSSNGNLIPLLEAVETTVRNENFLEISQNTPNITMPHEQTQQEEPPTTITTQEVYKPSRDQQRIYDMIYSMGPDSVWDKYLGLGEDSLNNLNGN